MLVYHRTVAVEKVLEEGFKDGPARRMVGVWLSDVPLDDDDGIMGDAVVVLDIPEEVLLPCERSGRDYRQFLVPAEVVNRHGPPRLHEHDWAGHSREAILRAAEVHLMCGRREMADRLRNVTVPFLERHGLLGESEEQD